MSEPDHNSVIQKPDDWKRDPAARASLSPSTQVGALLDDVPVPVLSDNGRPRVCPSCGGASVYALHMAMEGQACRYASKGGRVIAFYCGAHERQRRESDIDLAGDLKATDIGDWNLETLAAVRGMSSQVILHVHAARAVVSEAMRHIDNLEGELRTKTLALAESQAKETKLLGAVKRERKRRKKSETK